jgi:HSP20 family protein
MYPFDDDWINRRRRRPFDFFGMDDEFERMFIEMQRMMERMFQGMSSDSLEPGKSYVHGFNIRVGPDGKPNIEEFGNNRLKTPEGKPSISDERGPLTDIIEGDEDVSITLEVPGVEREDIDLKVKERNLEINVDSPYQKYHKVIDLPCNVLPNTTQATYKNGVLDISIKRKERKKGEGYQVDIK